MKLTENGITTIFVNPGYTVTGSTTVKHIFANGVVVATVTDNGTSSVTNYVLTDHLGGTSLVTDDSGNVVETMDYYPYGSMRLDTKAEGYAGEKRKYIGQEHDSGSGLEYLNARYYDSARGQFISQDPVFWEIGQTQVGKSILSNPQLLNSYAYAVGNPIVGKDADGRLVELISRPVFEARGYYIGAHTFFYITPDSPEQIDIGGVPSGATAFTLAGFPTGSGGPADFLTKGVGTSDSNRTDIDYALGNGKILNRVTITPPNGESDTTFINNIGGQFNAINLDGMRYFGLGHVPGLYNGNSNNFAYTLGVKSGAKDQVDKFNPNPGDAAHPGAKGYGAALPTTSLYRQTISTLTNIRNFLSSLVTTKTTK